MMENVNVIGKIMQINLRIVIWNANGISNHANEIFVKNNYIDIFLVSETHFTSRSFFRIKDYDIVFANHPDERAHGGAAILIWNNIKYEILNPTEENSAGV
ncbi:putative RNA-directed DNA polymerase from transposon X-element [Lucilia cuprina]|nr:putative RNA-directed DNA polymerase from transposon X-element [Lucilia cuprina]